MTRLGGWLGWLVIPTVLAMQAADLRRGLHGGPAIISAYLVGFTLLSVVCAPWILRRWGELDRSVRWMAALFTALLGYALLTACLIELPFVQDIQVTRPIVIVPLVTSFVTMAAAAGVVLVMPRADRLRRMWWAVWLVIGCSLAGWPRAVAVHESVRLSSAMGGAAVLHVVMLTCLAFFLGCLIQGFRQKASAVGAVVALLAVMATGSRAGLAALAVFIGLAALWALGRGLGRWAGWLVAAAGLVFVAALLIFPSMRRLLSITEPRRALNLRTALDVWSRDPVSQFIGVGSGRLWPWYALDVQMIPAPGGLLVRTVYGKVLGSPHSTYLAVLVELGVVGALLLAAMLGVLGWRLVGMWRDGRDAVSLMCTMAIVASLLTWLFDTYLLKNFGVSFWWWLIVFSAVGRRGDRPSPAPAPAATV